MAVTTFSKVLFIFVLLEPFELIKGSTSNDVLEDRIGIGVHGYPHQQNRRYQYQRLYLQNSLKRPNKHYIPQINSGNAQKTQLSPIIKDFRSKQLRQASFLRSKQYQKNSKSQGLKVAQRRKQTTIYGKSNFLRSPNFRKHHINNKAHSKSEPVVASANIVTKSHSYEKPYQNFDKNKEKGKKESGKHFSRITIDDEDLILQHELEIKIQQEREKNERFQRLLRQLENNGYKELQKERQERDALRYATASNDKKVYEVENNEGLINHGQQESVSNHQHSFDDQKWTNR